MNYRIQPKEYISENYIMDYYYYTKKEAISRYRKLRPQFLLKELLIEKI